MIGRFVDFVFFFFFSFRDVQIGKILEGFPFEKDFLKYDPHDFLATQGKDTAIDLLDQ